MIIWEIHSLFILWSKWLRTWENYILSRWLIEKHLQSFLSWYYNRLKWKWAVQLVCLHISRNFGDENLEKKPIFKTNVMEGKIKMEFFVWKSFLGKSLFDWLLLRCIHEQDHSKSFFISFFLHSADWFVRIFDKWIDRRFVFYRSNDLMLKNTSSNVHIVEMENFSDASRNFLPTIKKNDKF